MSPYVVTSWFWQFIDHWQTLIAGAFALVGGAIAYLAGAIQARATRQAADDQIAEARRKDFQQARCIAAAIIPELFQFGFRCDAAARLIAGLPEAERSDVITDDLVALIFRVTLEIPHLLSQHLANLYLLGDEAGPAAAKALSFTLQYNDMLKRLPEVAGQHADSNPWEMLRSLSGHLDAIKRDIGTTMAVSGSRFVYDAKMLW